VSFVIPNRTTHHHHHAAAKQKRKENSQILAKKERKKETIKQTDRQTREKERKKIREQSECEPAAPHPGSRVSNRYHRSVGKNQSPGVGPGHLSWKRVDLERPNQPGSRVFDCKGKVLACTNIVGAA